MKVPFVREAKGLRDPMERPNPLQANLSGNLWMKHLYCETSLHGPLHLIVLRRSSESMKFLREFLFRSDRHFGGRNGPYASCDAGTDHSHHAHAARIHLPVPEPGEGDKGVVVPEPSRQVQRVHNVGDEYRRPHAGAAVFSWQQPLRRGFSGGFVA